MLAWYASSPEHGGNPDLTVTANPPTPSSPHFRPTMQSPGPPYQGSMGSAMNYSERPYENQMGSHCQTNSYPSYQPPSPYRPHPVSPPAHAHQYGGHGNHQMHSSLAYGTGHQLGPYGSSQAHYASLNPDIYSSRPSMYSGNSRAMQQLKSTWGDNNSNNSTDLMQYSQPSPRPSMMPPPPIHSPPHGSMSATPGPPPAPPHYRQIPIVSAASHSPHSWSQSQIPSPGVLHTHSPRTTPSPLPAHTRSPGHNQPFSPPPTAPSPHHPPPSMTPHPQTPQKNTPSPPSGATTPAPTRQPLCNSPSGQVANSDPLQSLQKMVMLDSETVESPITRANYEMAANQGNPPPGAGRPASYFSVEQLAGSDPGSPYPTYYNLDQNRLCTPPRTCMSTPTSSTFSSAPDSTSSNSPRSDSRTTTASADSSTVGHINGDISHPENQTRRQDFDAFGVTDVRMTNGNHQTDPTLREEVGPVSSDSENKDTQDFLHHLGGGVPDIPEGDGTVDLRNTMRKSPKSPRGHRRAFGHDLHCDPSLLDSPMDKLPRNKAILMTGGRRNSTLQEFEITNGQPEGTGDEVYPNDGYTPRPPRYYSPTTRWNKMGAVEDGFISAQDKPFGEDCVAALPKPKRGRKKKMFGEHDGLVSEWDIYNPDLVHRTPRVARGSCTRGRRGSRRRGAGISAFARANGGDVPMDMYSGDASLLSMGNHPSNGMGDMVSSAPDKDLAWQGHGYHMGPPQGMGTEYVHKESLPSLKPPMLENQAMDNTAMNTGLGSSQAPPQNYQTDVASDDRTRGPLLFTVTKDGNTVKLQDGQVPNNSNPQTQYYDPVLGQMVSQPIKKKRGRPFGSKNKPKPPGEVRQPRKRRKKGETMFGPELPPMMIRPRIINGPYIHIVGRKDKPLVVSVVNVPPKDEEADAKYLLQKRQMQLGSVIRQKLGLSPNSTLSPLYDTVSKDKSWLCALCCKNSHYRGLGDLFGPYFLNGEQKPSITSTPPSPAPLSICGNDSNSIEDEEELEEKSQENLPLGDTSISDSSPVSQQRFQGKKRSDVMEQMFRAALLRKAKQANVQKPCEGPPESQPSAEVPISAPTQFPLDVSEDNKEFWVHENCATWSQGVYLLGHRVYGLEETVIEATETICARCKFAGASLSCAREECIEHYHYMCARDKWCQMDDENFTILCPKHKK